MPPSSIAILGAGLSGLSSAFHLSRRFPTVPITLVEKSQNLGGWVHSERVKLPDVEILLEGGPRTLRPHGKPVLELIHLLDLESSLVKVLKDSPAARHRFLHIPGTKGLTAVPSSLQAMSSSPLTRVLVPALLGATLRTGRRSKTTIDQSVDTFLTEQFGAKFAQTFGSALVHGIYAADSRNLSIRAAFPSLWDAAAGGSVVRGFIRRAFRSSGSRKEDVYELDDLPSKMTNVSAYSFSDGMQTITRALTKYLEGRQNVEILRSSTVTSLVKHTASSNFNVVTSSGRCVPSSHVVSCLSPSVLNKLIPSAPTSSIQSLSQNPSSSVTVVNIVFPPTSFPIHPPGFGYLVPRPREHATDEELEDHAGVLGVVFDSCALPDQDRYPSVDSPRYTKVTMMLGGPHLFSHTAESVRPDKLLRILTRHLAPPQPLPDPVLVRARHLTDCIPTPTVGHLQRIVDLKKELQESEVWQGRLEVIGAGVGGVSVPDCIEQGRHVGSSW